MGNSREEELPLNTKRPPASCCNWLSGEGIKMPESAFYMMLAFNFKMRIYGRAVAVSRLKAWPQVKWTIFSPQNRHQQDFLCYSQFNKKKIKKFLVVKSPQESLSSYQNSKFKNVKSIFYTAFFVKVTNTSSTRLSQQLFCLISYFWQMFE